MNDLSGTKIAESHFGLFVKIFSKFDTPGNTKGERNREIVAKRRFRVSGKE